MRSDNQTSKEISQLLTQITTNTNIKSIYIEPLWLNKECNHFLRMWYCQPFGNCNIPQVVDLHGKDSNQDAYEKQRNTTMIGSNKFISVAKID